MSVLTPSDILTFCRSRLEQNYVDTSLYDGTDILDLMSDAYVHACEESLVLRNLTGLALAAGQAEYVLPADLHALIRVVAGGRQLQPIPRTEALADFATTGIETSYYTYSNKIGVVPTPIEDGVMSVMIEYATTPARFTTYGDVLDARFPVEFADILVHYVRWRVQMLSGGAERIGAATGDRGLFDQRIKELRRLADSTGLMSPTRMAHVTDRRRVFGA